MKLSAELDADFLAEHPQRNVKAYADMYDSAIKMMKSEDLVAFDLTQESAAERVGKGRASVANSLRRPQLRVPGGAAVPD